MLFVFLKCDSFSGCLRQKYDSPLNYSQPWRVIYFFFARKGMNFKYKWFSL
ncbi:hypothetical protein HMPREF1981_01006 [Bacteroides pyogenes F0041]|uniref:Uncharacterized protein n=1 Tax=Bacteroides pyogenes F0041 TaxID=1321819 RepID=U2E1Q2_9BACE|nr:hypothetical protein HMPREF1981_01006 [Bacteroides pyogenes F0041]GAE22472.1 hypothetical protein JCM10003_2078 [Bacteroides pyogenes JCM 10003]